MKKSSLVFVLLLFNSSLAADEAPYLQPGGDLIDFQLRENTPPNSVVYTLKGYDPEFGSQGLSYTISGDYFSINQKTGVISLRKAVDREAESLLQVVITLSDKGNNLIPFQREIEILDENDNAPVFQSEPYSFSVNETAPVGSLLYSSILVSDRDTRDNAAVSLECVPRDPSDETCELFSVSSEELQPGSYRGRITLSKALNYEKKSNYKLTIRAVDAGFPRALSSSTEIFVQLVDVQDQPPFFINSPYLSTIPENIPPNTPIFDVQVRDGDTGRPQQIVLDILGDTNGFFLLEPLTEGGPIASATLRTRPNAVIDRETPSILSQGGIYNFQIRAREILESDGVSFGDESTTNVTVIIRDEDDSIPVFNKAEITVAVPENVGFDTPLPDLNLMVEDHDSAGNAGFTLALEEPGPFSVHPQSAVGKTPVILRVAHPELLDYESPDKNSYEVKINALQDGSILSTVLIKVIVTDANDNSPIFDEEFYSFSVAENAPAGTSIGSITAQDADSGSFGQVEYDLKGFGADKFNVNPESGEIFINTCMENTALWKESCLDYETQELYSLTYTGRDGGNEISTVTVNIQILDVNDNYPKFTETNYSRTVSEGSTHFDPKFFVKAIDVDGISQGGGKVFYSIHSLNTDITLFDIDVVTGEITLLQPVPYMNELPSDGRFELVIRATDSGKPTALYSDVKVIVDIHAVTHLVPVFGAPEYRASLLENATRGSPVTRVGATVPGVGSSVGLSYKIFSGGKDNFVIDSQSGEISVSEDAVLDIQENGDYYEIIILASNDVPPHPQTSKANVSISIIDVNDKAPKFDQVSYTSYINEQISIGEEVLRLTASDEDRNSVLKYSIVNPVIAIDKAGNLLTNKATYDFTSTFRIDPDDGSIYLNNSLSYNSASVIVVTAQVEDTNAQSDSPQVASTEVTFYVQAYKVDFPQFEAPWTQSQPSLVFKVPEGQEPGSPLFKIHASDPIDPSSGIRFEKSELSDPDNLISIDPESGQVFNNQIFDFDEGSGQHHIISFTVLARSLRDDKASEASVEIRLQDVNDNSPVFEANSYEAELNESSLPLSKVLEVVATDKDSGVFGELEFSLFGEGSDSFSIHPSEGTIFVQKGPDGRSLIDRERIDEYKLTVLVKDSPGNGDSRSASVDAFIRILDSNDEAPLFSKASYSAVVPENSPLGTLVARLSAEDPDIGPSGDITYGFVESSKVDRVFAIDELSGEIRTAGSLTGKGRKDPYIIYARAMDQGEPQLFTDVEVYITIGDVSENDGTPTFIRPKIGEIAYISEDASIGSSVYRASATDPDDSNTANGKIVYSLPNAGPVIRRLFSLHPVSGLLTTLDKLDRETRSNYTLILEARDLGTPAQATSISLLVKIQDVNDHPPRFPSSYSRAIPREISIQEHTNIGTEILTLSAVDEDEGENALIGYDIPEGNEGAYFEIFRTEGNEGIVFISKDIDREEHESFLLGIRCFHPGAPNASASVEESPDSLLHVRVLISDIDDNPPTFTHKNASFGVRVNSAVYTEVASLSAVDIDASAEPITYEILNITYSRPSTGLFSFIDPQLFIIDPMSGTLHTNRTLGRYLDGQFVLFVRASNGPGRFDVERIVVYVLQDTELMRFVFDSDPHVVRGMIPGLKAEIEGVFINPLKFNIYDTEFYSKRDGSLDFGRTGSCFQVLNNEAVVDLSSSEALLRNNAELKSIYQKYDIIDVERCAKIHSSAPGMQWPEILFISVAVLVGLLSILASVILCCIYTWHKRVLLRNSPVKIIEARVRTFVHTSLPPGSTINGGGGVSSIMESDLRDFHDHHPPESLFNDYRPYENIKNG